MARTGTDRTTKASKPAPPKGRAKAPDKGGRGRAAATQAVSRAEERDNPDQLRDIWGVVFLVMAFLAGLGLYFEAAGTVGVFLTLLLRGLFGVFGLSAPLALAAVGIVLLGERRSANLRIALGATLIACGLVGVWHVLQGAPGFSAELAVLHASGGWLGAALVLPLQAVAATAGAVVLLVALALIGLLIATATSPKVIGHWVSEQVVRGRDAIDARRASRDERDRDDAEAVTVLAGELDEAVPDPTTLADAAAVTVADDQTTGPIFEGLDDRAEEGADANAPSDTATILMTDAAAAHKLAPPREGDPWAGYELPSRALLRTGRAAPGNKKTLDQMTRALEHTLRQFGVDAAVERVSRGPTVTRFEISLGEGVRVGAVTKLGDDISYALATPEIRIVAPIPGKSAIGIEVPNRDRDHITLGDVLRSPEAAAHAHPLAVGVGVDIAGNSVMVNLAKMPHLLIAGATGSGKSVTMNGIVTSLCMRASPRQVRMILVDPKRVELNHYEGAPHLLTPVVTDPKRATEALAWTVKEMEDRYERLAMLGYRNIDAYNAAVAEGSVRDAPVLSGEADTTWEALPYVVFVIDELADLMMVAPRDVENHIVRIAQMARAVGIHLVIATQRPSVDVVTGLIKANVPSRLALAMATQTDSRTILDQGGAEKLVGLGDMLFLPANASKPHRIQGCYVDEAEIEQVIAHCKAQKEPDYQTGVVRSGDQARMADHTGDDASDSDLTKAAMELVVRSGLGSTSMLQRKLKVGFARAGRLMDELEETGVVGPSEGPKARQVLMSVEELEQHLDSGS
ncbi:hypothetical protein BH20ACT8_BH20ACT8_16870 [soil metagenome]